MTVSALPTATPLDDAFLVAIPRGFLNPEKFDGDFYKDLPMEAIEATRGELRRTLRLLKADGMKHGTVDKGRIAAGADDDSDEVLRFINAAIDTSEGVPPEPGEILRRINNAFHETMYPSKAAQAEVTTPAPVAAVIDPKAALKTTTTAPEVETVAEEADEDVALRKMLLFEDITVDKILPPTGFLRDYVEYWSEQTDAPKLFHLLLAYVTLAAVVGGRVYFMLAGDNLYPNLWIVIIGKSGDGRKSTSLNKSKGCVWAIDPKAIFPPDFTTEALLDLLAANPQGVFYHSEFRSLYGMLSKDYMSGAKALLTELYDSPPEYRRETKGKSVIIHQPVISMASATTTQWLKSRNAEDDFGGGFLARYLFVPVFKRERSLALPPDPDPRRFSGLVRFLQEIRDTYATTVEARYTPAAKAMFIEWYNQFDALAPFADTPLAPFHARYQSAVHKIAMLYTISVGGNVRAMDIDAVTYATATVEFITKSLLSLYDKHLTFGKSDEAIKKVMDLIPEKKGIIRSALLRQSRMKVKEFDEVIATLIETERVTVEPSIKSGGRQGLVYKRKVGK